MSKVWLTELSGTRAGDVPPTGEIFLYAYGGAWYFMDDTGTEFPLAASAISDGDYGDIVVSGSGTIWTIDAGVVTLANWASGILDTDGALTANSDSKVPSQKAVKSYVDAVASGLSPKTSVKLATTAALPTNTYSNGVSGVGATLTGTATGVLTIDGVAVALNDRVLVKDEAAPANNGIYKCTLAGAIGVAYILTRTTDNDTSAEIIGSYVFVEAGTANASAGFVNTNSSAITVGTTAINFTQFSGAGEITAGAALTKSGNTLDVAVDGSSIEINSDALRVKALGITNAMLAGLIDLTSKVTGALPIANGGTGQAAAGPGLDALTVKGADIAAATTTNIGAGTGRNITITGNTTLTGFDTVAAGIERVLTFTGTPLLTYNATSLILPGAANYQVVAGDVLKFESLGSGNWRCTGYALISGAAITGSGSSGHGQCYLAKSSSNLLLSPLNGNQLIINSVAKSIPDIGVTLAPASDVVTMTIASPCVVTLPSPLAANVPIKLSTSGALATGLTAGVTYYVKSPSVSTCNLSATPGGAAINTTGSQSGTHKMGTLRYIYAYMSGSTMTLEQSVTVSAIQATTNVRIKSGDATRTLVGMAFDYADAWIDTGAQVLVLSYFNRRNKVGNSFLSASRTTTSTSYVELNSEIRIEFLTWADEALSLAFVGVCTNGATGGDNYMTFAFDGTTAEDVWTGAQGYTAGAFISFAIELNKSGLADGYHYSTVLVKVGTNTGTWNGGGTAGLRDSSTLLIRG